MPTQPAEPAPAKGPAKAPEPAKAPPAPPAPAARRFPMWRVVAVVLGAVSAQLLINYARATSARAPSAWPSSAGGGGCDEAAWARAIAVLEHAVRLDDDNVETGSARWFASLAALRRASDAAALEGFGKDATGRAVLYKLCEIVGCDGCDSDNGHHAPLACL